MASPLVSGVAPVSIGAAPIEPGPPPPIPNAAVQITPSAETISSRDTTAANTRATSDARQTDPLAKALKLVNSSLRAWSTGMRFDIDPEARRVVVSIVDSETGDVLRTVPTDAVIRVAKMIVQLQGKSINTKA